MLVPKIFLILAIWAIVAAWATAILRHLSRIHRGYREENDNA